MYQYLPLAVGGQKMPAVCSRWISLWPYITMLWSLWLFNNRTTFHPWIWYICLHVCTFIYIDLTNQPNVGHNIPRMDCWDWLEYGHLKKRGRPNDHGGNPHFIQSTLHNWHCYPHGVPLFWRTLMCIERTTYPPIYIDFEKMGRGCIVRAAPVRKL